MADYEKGSMPPSGYLNWRAWAEAQHKAGLRQKQCRMCELWKFPQEKSACTACGSTAASGVQPSVETLMARREYIRATLYKQSIPDDLPTDIDRRFEMIDELDRKIAAAAGVRVDGGMSHE